MPTELNKIRRDQIREFARIREQKLGIQAAQPAEASSTHAGAISDFDPRE